MIFDNYPYLENEKLILKRLTMKDLSDLEQMIHDAQIYRYEPTYLPELMADSCESFIMKDCPRLFNEKTGIILGIYKKDDPDLFLGISELYGYSAERDKISIGYRLKRDYWNKGIATEVVAILKSYILNDLKMVRITAHVRTENPASERCLLKNGFVQRRAAHKEDWGYEFPVMANKYVIYPEVSK